MNIIKQGNRLSFFDNEAFENLKHLENSIKQNFKILGYFSLV